MSSQTNYDLGKRIRRRRKLLDLSVADLASRLGVSSSLIQQYESGRMSPRATPQSLPVRGGPSLVEIAEALETTAGTLLGEVPETFPESVA